MLKRTIQVLLGVGGGGGDRGWKESIFLLTKIIYIHIIRTMKYQRTYDEKLVSYSKPNASKESLDISKSFKSKHLCLQSCSIRFTSIYRYSKVKDQCRQYIKFPHPHPSSCQGLIALLFLVLLSNVQLYILKPSLLVLPTCHYLTPLDLQKDIGNPTFSFIFPNATFCQLHFHSVEFINVY